SATLRRYDEGVNRCRIVVPRAADTRRVAEAAQTSPSSVSTSQRWARLRRPCGARWYLSDAPFRAACALQAISTASVALSAFSSADRSMSSGVPARATCGACASACAAFAYEIAPLTRSVPSVSDSTLKYGAPLTSCPAAP